MPIRNDILVEIGSTLGSLAGSNLNSYSALDNLYEVYIFSLILRACRNQGGHFTLRNITATHRGTRMYFRTAPGYISSTTRNYTYADLNFVNKPPLEAHVSIRCTGQSTVLHEADVCVLFKSEAELCRMARARVAPKSAKIIITAETKFYTAALGLHLGRSFLGLVSDFSSDFPIFITNTNSDSIEKLLSKRGKHWEHKITPSNVGDVNRLIGIFETAFKGFKAKH